MQTTTEGVAHDCSWIGGCRCLIDGSLCACTHDHGLHGDAPVEYDGACTVDGCECGWFDRLGVDGKRAPWPSLLDVFSYLAEQELTRGA